MYQYFDINPENTSFEWDDDKDKLSFTKHGIHFKTAAKVFPDPDKLIREDEEHPGKLRHNVLGKVKNVLFEVCAFKDDDTIRLISARTATKSEKERYEYGEDEY